MNTSTHDQIYDVVVAGGGLAGILFSLRQPESARVLIVEKESSLGGRQALAGYGLGALSGNLFRFCENILREYEIDLHQEIVEVPAKIGILVGSKLTQFNRDDLAKDASVKAFSGQAGLKDWPQVAELLQEKSEMPFAEKAKIGRKSGAALALHAFALLSGIPDPWLSVVGALDERLTAEREKAVFLNWSKVLPQLETALINRGITILKETRVVSASYKNDLWELRCGQEDIRGNFLAVAQPPWSAQLWLAKPEWPVALLQLASKTKPVSSVALSFDIAKTDGTEMHYDLPPVILIPSEDAQARFEPSHGLVFQQALDYEESFQAPNVVKSIKSLKRAAKKFEQAFPQFKLSREHVALLPITWPHATGKIEAKTIAKLTMKELQDQKLTFVGDAYGDSYDDEKNLIHSLQASNTR